MKIEDIENQYNETEGLYLEDWTSEHVPNLIAVAKAAKILLDENQVMHFEGTNMSVLEDAIEELEK